MIKKSLINLSSFHSRETNLNILQTEHKKKINTKKNHNLIYVVLHHRLLSSSTVVLYCRVMSVVLIPNIYNKTIVGTVYRKKVQKNPQIYYKKFKLIELIYKKKIHRVPIASCPWSCRQNRMKYIIFLNNKLLYIIIQHIRRFFIRSRFWIIMIIL